MTTIFDLMKKKNNSPNMEVNNGGEFVPIKAILGDKILITRADPYKNEQGPGVFIEFTYDGVPGYTCTHARQPVEVLGDQGAQECLDAGDYLEGTFTEFPSRTTPGRMVIKLV